MPNPINEKVRILSLDSHNDFNLAKHFKQWKEVAKHSCLEEIFFRKKKEQSQSHPQPRHARYTKNRASATTSLTDGT